MQIRNLRLTSRESSPLLAGPSRLIQLTISLATTSPVFCLLFQIIELMTGGAQTPVTNANKIFYLNLLAQYRLASQVKEEVEHFLKGGTLSPCA